MGWFRRDTSSDGDGFYRGDAPVLMPGVDGEAPSAYFAGSRPPNPSDPVADHPPPGYPPPGYPPPGYPPPGYPPPGSMPPRAVPGATERTVRRAGLGCVAVVAVGVLIAVAGAVIAVIASVRSSLPDLGESGPDTVVGAIDVPTTVRYNDTELRITIGGAQAQPGSGWQWSSNAEPNLVIATSLLQQDSAVLTIPFVDWKFQPGDSQDADPVGVNFISGFEPDIGTASLAAGEAEVGYLSFQTPSTTGTLVLEGDYGDPPLATWEITASPAAVITGAVGTPVRAQVGMPPFTVTLDATTWVEPTAEIVRRPPAGGSYLVADLTLTSTGETSSGIIEHEMFVFVPTGGQDVVSVGPSLVQDTTSITSVIGGSSAPVRVAFDVPTGPGTLELRDGAGRTMIQWPVL